MPNWCLNVCEIDFIDVASLNKFIENYLSEDVDGNKLTNPKNPTWKFSKIRPIKEEAIDDEEDSLGLDGNMKKINAWGVKWEPEIDQYQINGKTLNLEFETPWGPPIGIYQYLTTNKDNFGINFIEGEGIEPGMDFGVKFYDGEDRGYSTINREMANDFRLINIHGYLNDLEEGDEE